MQKNPFQLFTHFPSDTYCTGKRTFTVFEETIFQWVLLWSFQSISTGICCLMFAVIQIRLLELKASKWSFLQLPNLNLTLLSEVIILKAWQTPSSLIPPPRSKKLAGFPPCNLIMSIVAIARPAPFTRKRKHWRYTDHERQQMIIAQWGSNMTFAEKYLLQTILILLICNLD